MDRMLYVAMTGAKETLNAQAVNNHNLANASTTGFRAELSAFQSRAVDGSGYASRVYATNASVGWDNQSGALLSTGRDLDVAIHGDGWIAVQGARPAMGHMRFTAADGTDRFIAVCAFPLFTSQEQFDGALLLFWEDEES